MLSADIKSLTEAYNSIYEEKVELTEELLDETFDELVDELIEEGYEEEEALSILEDATDAYLEEAKVTFGHDTTARRASGAPVGARRKYGKRKAGEALKAAGSAVKSAADSAKKKASAAKAGVQIAGSIAKDEARRAGRKAAHAVTSAPGKAKAAVDRKKQETKRGIKGFIKRQAEKVVKRMSEGNTPFSGAGYELEGEQINEAPYHDPGGSGTLADVMRQAGMNNAPVGQGRGYRPAPAPTGRAGGPGGFVKQASLKNKKPTTQMAGYELEGEQLVERLKATGLFSEEEIAKIAEQMTTQTQIPPVGDSLKPGKPSGAPPAPVLPKPQVKKKPEPKLGHGTPGFQYGLGTGP